MIVPFLSFSVFPIWQKDYRGSSVSAEPGGPKQTPPTNTSRRETFAGNPKSGSKKSVVPNAPNALISVFPVPEITWLSVKNSPAQSGGRKRASPFGVRRALTRTVSPVWRVWSGEHPSNERRARTDVVCQATRTKGGPSSSRSVILGTR